MHGSIKVRRIDGREMIAPFERSQDSADAIGKTEPGSGRKWVSRPVFCQDQTHEIGPVEAQ
jgi:hypothetical protein